jgi:hypothetical protein
MTGHHLHIVHRNDHFDAYGPEMVHPPRERLGLGHLLISVCALLGWALLIVAPVVAFVVLVTVWQMNVRGWLP